MSDHFPAQILIGGTIPRSLMPGLIEALHQDRVSHDYGEGAIQPDCSVEELLDRYLADGHLKFRDDQAHNGEFEATERFCRENGIPFDRWSDHYCEYDAENAYFRPGMTVPVITYADSNGKEVICGATVREGLRLIKEFYDNYDASDSSEHWKKLIEGMRTVRSACPTLPDPLDPVAISGREVVS